MACEVVHTFGTHASFVRDVTDTTAGYKMAHSRFWFGDLQTSTVKKRTRNRVKDGRVYFWFIIATVRETSSSASVPVTEVLTRFLSALQ